MTDRAARNESEPSTIMATREPKDIAAIFRDGTLIDEALNAAARDAVQLHKEKGLPLVVWRDGKTVWITPEEAEQTLASQKRE
jgi:hypothetical protein